MTTPIYVLEQFRQVKLGSSREDRRREVFRELIARARAHAAVDEAIRLDKRGRKLVRDAIKATK